MKNIHLLKNTLLIVFIFFIHNLVFAQENGRKIIFLEEAYDFGVIQETQGQVKHTFQFVNAGKKSVQVLSVNASCGCTTPFWERNPILPGNTGKIEVAFNPLNRPGSFDKIVTVSTNSEAQPRLLKIYGYVQPKNISLKDEFPYEMGAIRTQSKFLNFGTITTEKAITKNFSIYNQSEDTITFSNNKLSGKFLQIKVIPTTLPPKTQAEIQVTYMPKKRNDLGFVNDQVVLFTNEPGAKEKRLSVIATILEYFPPLTEKELKEAPNIEFEEPSYDFGHIKEGELLKHSFLFKNAGKEALNIRKIKTSCSCIKTELKKLTYPGDEEGQLKVIFDTSGTSGSQVKAITIFTNDPSAPVKDIILKAYVKD